MKTISMHTEGFKVDRDGYLSLDVRDDNILENFSIGEILNHFGEGEILEVMDDSDIVKYLEQNNYNVEELDD